MVLSERMAVNYERNLVAYGVRTLMYRRTFPYFKNVRSFH